MDPMIWKSGTDWTRPASGLGYPPLTQQSRTSAAFTGGSSPGTSRSVIEPMSEDTISEDAIRDQLSRSLESSIFVQSERLGQFLRFTVETTLQDKAETLKEYVVGTHVYGRKPSYQPTEDSIVRSEARRLRRKLQEFYETIGKDDLILIHYRPGSYVPAFKMREKGSTSPNAIDGLGEGSPITDHQLARIIKRLAGAAGLDPAVFSGHSLRSGLATSAAEGGASERSIMEQTRHRSLKQVRKYIRRGSLFQDNAAARSGL
jgi:hypothetical protein